MRVLIWILIISVYFTAHIKSQPGNDSGAVQLTKVYKLGEVVVVANKNKEIISQDIMQKLNTPDVAKSIAILPSVVLVKTGARNESTVYLRGFDLKSVPVFVDGVPVYVPFDGYVDLARFTTPGLSKIEVSKGYSSVLFGANNIGGSINLISLKPTGKLDVNLSAGILSGKGYQTRADFGSAVGKFYFQGSFSKFNRPDYKLSKNFDTTANETNWERDNSYYNDDKISLKIGFTPNQNNEYSVNYIYQHGEKGNPVYLGTDPLVKLRYWQWPVWDKQSLYFISKTTIAQKNYVKTRLFFDKFINTLKSYDDNSYTTQSKGYAFTNFYNDYSYGGSVEAGTEMLQKNVVKFAAHYKTDVHREHNEGEPVRNFSDYTFSAGLENVYSPANLLKIVPGISYNLRNSITADNYNTKTKEITQYAANKSHAANAQIAVIYNFGNSYSINLNAGYKTRFATMKDRYSYRLGTALPNPELLPENAANFELASTFKTGNKITWEPALFYSKLNNTIQMVSDVAPGISQLQNTGIAEFYGADFLMNYQVVKTLKLSVNYTYIQRKNITNPEILFTNIPVHKLFAFIDFYPVKTFAMLLSYEYNSERYSNSNGIVSPEFMIFNSHIAYKISKYFKTEAGINNIFDVNYSLDEGYPEEGRNFYLSLIFNLQNPVINR